MGSINLAHLNVKPEAMENLFNNNYECLFNHIQIGNKLYFFTVSEDRKTLSLKIFDIKGPDAELSEDSVETL